MRPIRRLCSRQMLTEEGAAIVMAFILSFMAAVLAVAAARMIVGSSRESRQFVAAYAEADSAARAGLVDAIHWFRQQGTVINNDAGLFSHPDEAFRPLQFPTPPMLPETENEEIGLVRSFNLETEAANPAKLMAAYVVQRQPEYRIQPTFTEVALLPGTPSPTPTPTPAPFIENAVHDVTGSRMSGTGLEEVPCTGTPTPNATCLALRPTYKDGDGLVWLLNSAGYVFRDTNKNDRLDFPVTEVNAGVTQVTPSPDEVLAKARAYTEIKRVNINAPYAGIVCRRGDAITLTGKARLFGESGYFNASYPPSTGTPRTLSGGSVQGNGDIHAGLNVTVSSIWSGLTLGEIRGLADSAVTSVADLPYNDVDSDSLPDTLPSYKFYFIDGNAHFTSTYLFNGTGILFINGNLTVDPIIHITRFHKFRGVVYVTGNTVIDALTGFYGTLVCQGNVLIRGSGSEYAEVACSKDARDDVDTQMLQYRENRSITRVIHVPLQ